MILVGLLLGTGCARLLVLVRLFVRAGLQRMACFYRALLCLTQVLFVIINMLETLVVMGGTPVQGSLHRAVKVIVRS